VVDVESAGGQNGGYPQTTAVVGLQVYRLDTAMAFLVLFLRGSLLHRYWEVIVRANRLTVENREVEMWFPVVGAQVEDGFVQLLLQVLHDVSFDSTFDSTVLNSLPLSPLEALRIGWMMETTLSMRFRMSAFSAWTASFSLRTTCRS